MVHARGKIYKKRKVITCDRNALKDDNNVQFTNIKINNKILHQSKLVNYFKEDASYKKIDKDLKELLKKIKKNKKYFFSMKDVILIESLKSDGIKVPERYKDLYELDDSEIPREGVDCRCL